MWRINENIKEIRAKAERDFTNRVFSTIAPFYNTKITAGNLKEIRTKVEDDFTRRANHVANLLGINLIGITTNIENFGLEKGKTAAEAMAGLSYTFELEGPSEKTALFASLVNDLGYKPQETVITSKVVNSAEEADAVQITYPLGNKSRKETLELINKLGIENYSIDPRTNVITVTVFNQKDGKLTLTAEEAEKQRTLSEELYGKERSGWKCSSKFLKSDYFNTRVRREIYARELEKDGNRGKQQDVRLHKKLKEGLRETTIKVQDSNIQKESQFFGENDAISSNTVVINEGNSGEENSVTRRNTEKEIKENARISIPLGKSINDIILGKRTAITIERNNATKRDFYILKDIEAGQIFSIKDNSGKTVFVRATKKLHKVKREGVGDEWAERNFDDTREREIFAIKDNREFSEVEFEYVGDKIDALLNKDKVLGEIKDVFQRALDNGSQDFRLDFISEINDPDVINRVVEYINNVADDFGCIPFNVIFPYNLNIGKLNITVREETESDTTTSSSISIEQRRKANLAFSPKMRKARANTIARFFSNYLDTEVANFDRQAQKTLADETISEEEKQELRATLATLEATGEKRLEVLRRVGPKKLLGKVKNIFTTLLNKSEDEIREIKRKSDLRRNPNLTEEQLEQSANDYIKIIKEKYPAIIENFAALAEEAIPIINKREQITINEDSVLSYINSQESMLQEEFNEDGTEKIVDMEEQPKDHFLSDFRTTSSQETMSMRVRKKLGEIIKINPDGTPVLDDMSMGVYLNEDEVYSTLKRDLSSMVTSEDMIPLLEESAKTKPWVKQVIQTVKKDPLFKTQLFHNMRSDFQEYWVQEKSKESKGYNTLPINRKSGIWHMLNSWKNNIEGGNVLTTTSTSNKYSSIYDNNGNIIKENVKRAEANTFEIEDKIQEIKDTNDLDKDFFKQVSNLLKSFGINIETDIIEQTIKSNKPEAVYDGLSPLFIITGVAIENSITTTNNFYKKFSTAYSSIAKFFTPAVGSVMEDSARQNGKNYQSYVAPSYLGKLMKSIKDKNTEKSTRFLDENYKAFGWFYSKKADFFLSDWIDKLYKNEIFNREKGMRFRDLIAHKTVLNQDGKDYVDWGKKDVILSLLTEFQKADVDGTAWYYVPLFSDAPSADFIRFVKYGDEAGDFKEGDKPYRESIKEKLRGVVMQEYERIILVKERDAIRNSEKATTEEKERVKYQENYDIKRDKNGETVNVGGAEFKFFPQFNEWGVFDAIKDFLEDPNNSGEYPSKLVDRFVERYLEEGLDNALEVWKNEQVFKLDEYGEYKNFDISTELDIDAIDNILDNLSNEFFGIMDEHYATEVPIEHKDMISKAYDKYLDLSNYIYHAKGKPDHRVVNKYLNELRTAIKELPNLEVYDKIKKKSIELSEASPLIKFLRNYYYNNALATSQIIQLTNTDLAYFKDMTDFYKRNKQNHAPSLRLDTSAVNPFTGEKVGRKVERAIYLKDEYIPSIGVEDIRKILTERGVSKVEIDFICSQFRNVNVTDAQSYRSLDSYMAVKCMIGDWTQQMETAYNNILNDKWSATDMMTVFNTLKPYVYTQTAIDSGVADKGKVKQHIQHKNSEFLLLATYNLVSGALGRSKKLRILDQFMRDNQIDVVHFESVVKVGKQGAIDVNQFDENNLDGFKEYLEKAIRTEDGNYNPQVVHEISYEDYGIQMETGQHIVDTNNLIGTQVQRLIGGDISESAVLELGQVDDLLLSDMSDDEVIPSLGVTVGSLRSQSGISPKQFDELKWARNNARHAMNEYDDYADLQYKEGEKIDQNKLNSLINDIRFKGSLYETEREGINLGLNKKQWHTLFNALMVENIIQGYNKVDKLFSDKKSISDVLKRQINSSPRYSRDLLDACSLDENGEFIIPLVDPTNSDRVQALMASIMRKEITQQKIKGGALFQASSFGLTDELNIIYEGEGENKRIKEFECYMPAYSREFFEPFMNPKTHELDISQLPDELKEIVGYRIPTEDKYSMMPLKIKGFLPSSMGTAIMLPAEITTITGSGFGIDELQLMLPEFDIIEYNKGKARAAYKEQYKLSTRDKALETNSDIPSFDTWFDENKENFRYNKPKFSKVKYDFSKSPKENGTRARNNLYLDLVRSVLTNSDTADKVLKGGDPTEHHRVGMINTILMNATRKEIAEAIGCKESETIKKLLSADAGTVSDLAKKLSPKMDPLSPISQLVSHQANMVGQKMIGIYAINQVQNSILQYADGIAFSDPLFLNGRSRTKLTEMLDDSGGARSFITRNIAGYLSMAVDNGKNQMLATHNQNDFTCKVTMALIRVGYQPREVALLLQQPIIRRMTDAYYSKEYGEYASAKDVIDNVIGELEGKLYKLNENYYFGSTKSYDLTKWNTDGIYSMESLADNILRDTEARKNHSKVESPLDLEKQHRIALLFKALYKQGEELSDFVNRTRPDQVKSAAGPTIAQTQENEAKYVDAYRKNTPSVIESDSKSSPTITGVNIFDITDDIENITEDELRKMSMESSTPYLQAQFLCGIQGAKKFYGKFFPYYNENIIEAKNKVLRLAKSNHISAKEVNDIYQELSTYVLSSAEFLAGDTALMGDERFLNGYEEVKDYYINEFPDDFQALKKESDEDENSDLKSNFFINNLTVAFDKNANSKVIELNTAGKMTRETRESIQRDWEDLLYSSNPKYVKLAQALFTYSYFRSGLAYTPKGFGHLAPSSVKISVPGFVDAIKLLDDKNLNFDEFAEQFIINHRNNNKLVANAYSLDKREFINTVNGKNEIKTELLFDTSGEDSGKRYKSIIKERYYSGGKVRYLYSPFIKKTINSRDFVYTLTEYTDNTVKYRLVQNLGMPSVFKEYSFGKNYDEIDSSLIANINNTDLSWNRRTMRTIDVLRKSSGMKVYGYYVKEDVAAVVENSQKE